MPFAIHQSKKNHKMYLFTRRKNDLSYVPEGVLKELGKTKFLRNSFPQEKETGKIFPHYKEIENFVSAKGYFVMKFE